MCVCGWGKGHTQAAERRLLEGRGERTTKKRDTHHTTSCLDLGRFNLPGNSTEKTGAQWSAVVCWNFVTLNILLCCPVRCRRWLAFSLCATRQRWCGNSNAGQLVWFWVGGLIGNGQSKIKNQKSKNCMNQSWEVNTQSALTFGGQLSGYWWYAAVLCVWQQNENCWNGGFIVIYI